MYVILQRLWMVVKEMVDSTLVDNHMEDSVILEAVGFQNSMQAATLVPESECKKGLFASPSMFVTIIGISEYTNPSPYPSLSWVSARQ
ncbi:unnamed protein product [Prunus armeniaca]